MRSACARPVASTNAGIGGGSGKECGNEDSYVGATRISGSANRGLRSLPVGKQVSSFL